MKNVPMIYSLSDYALLLVKGLDARKFLQGQVTCDIDALRFENVSAESDQSKNTILASSTLGAHCTHKGRIVFTFRALPIDALTIALAIPSDMMSIALPALKKYSIFSKVELIDASETYQLFGFSGETAQPFFSSFMDTDKLTQENNTALISDKGIALAIDTHRTELWLNNEQAALLSQSLTDNEINYSDKDQWIVDNINAGITDIRPNTSGILTPHAINLHTTFTAVSFKKGCYTGQEVVARMHYLGKLKRQLFIFDYDSSNTERVSVNVGDAVYAPDKQQSIGDIVTVATTDTGYRLLISVGVEQAEKNHVFLDDKHTHPLSLVTAV